MRISSPAFGHNQSIPIQYTCDGKNINPPLEFYNIPESTKSLALIMEDPDVPKYLREDGLWVHWLIWNIDPTIVGIIEGKGAPAGSVEGITTYGRSGYGGPCPPDREHRYFFKLYALDVVLDLDESNDRNALLDAMRTHILQQAELIGLYRRI